MSWIRVETRMPKHRKVRRLASALKISKRNAVGLLMTFWMNVADEAPDGDLLGFELEDIAAAAEWGTENGDTDAQEFVGALKQVGLLDFVDNHYRVHDWEEYAESWKAAERMRKLRQSRGLSQNGSSTVLHSSSTGPTDRPDRPTDGSRARDLTDQPPPRNGVLDPRAEREAIAAGQREARERLLKR